MIKIIMPCGLKIESDVQMSAPGVCRACYKSDCPHRMTPSIGELLFNTKKAEEKKE